MESLSLQNMRALLMRWGPAVVMMALIFMASSIPDQDFPDLGLWDLIISKGGHMIGYGLLGVAYLLGLRAGGPVRRRHLALAVVLACLYGATDEFHQSFVPGRGPSPLDVAIDTVGAALGVAAAVWMGRKGRG